MSHPYLEDISAIWEQVREKFHQTLSTETVNLWFGDMYVIGFEDDVITLCTTSEFKCRTLQNRFKDAITQHFCDILGFPIEIKLTYRGPSLYSKMASDLIRFEAKEEPPTPTFEEFIESKIPTDEEIDRNSLDPVTKQLLSYTFDNFIIGESNKFAHAACYAVAREPSSNKYNPLFIYGQSGLGKTHLLRAIIHEIKKNNPAVRIVYIKGEDFMNQMIASIREGTTQQFRDKYRSCDVLLIDDIQFIASKEATQDEFFHTFDALFQENKQIILASDRPARDINPLAERLRSRFEWGLTADIQPPDLELRIAIIQQKAEQNRISLPPDVLMFLAENLRSNIRQIEGAIKKLGALTFLSGRPINMELAHSCIAELIGGGEPTNVTIDKVFSAIFKKYNIHREEIISARRNKEIAWARHVSIYLIRTLTDMSFPSISNIYNRHYSTIMSSFEIIENELKTDQMLQLDIADLKKDIQGG